MNNWSTLKKGDLVDLVAPGYPAHQDHLQSGIQTLESWGLRVRLPADTFQTYEFHSNTDEKRLQFFLNAVKAKDSKAIWAVRGGYGAGRLISEILKKMKTKPGCKLFVGLSDNTSLHFLMNQKWGWSTVHGPVVERLGNPTLPQDLLEETRALVFGEKTEQTFSNLVAMNSAAKKKHRISGSVVGGNLTTIQSLIGTKVSPRLAGKILFLEDTGERGYRLDRMLEQFDQVGLFQKVRAVVLGDFIGGDEPMAIQKERAIQSYVPFALQRFADSLSVPVFSGLQVGHGDHQRSLPLGAKAVLTGGHLSCLSGSQKEKKK